VYGNRPGSCDPLDRLQAVELAYPYRVPLNAGWCEPYIGDARLRRIVDHLATILRCGT